MWTGAQKVTSRRLSNRPAAGLLVLAVTILGCSPYRTIEVNTSDEAPHLCDAKSGEAQSAEDILGKRVTVATSDGQLLSGRVLEVTSGALTIEIGATEVTFGTTQPVSKTLDLAAVESIRVEGRQTFAKILAVTVVGTIVFVAVAFLHGLGQFAGS
jgi:hypothetical protein